MPDYRSACIVDAKLYDVHQVYACKYVHAHGHAYRCRGESDKGEICC